MAAQAGAAQANAAAWYNYSPLEANGMLMPPAPSRGRPSSAQANRKKGRGLPQQFDTESFKNLAKCVALPPLRRCTYMYSAHPRSSRASTRTRRHASLECLVSFFHPPTPHSTADRTDATFPALR